MFFRLYRSIALMAILTLAGAMLPFGGFGAEAAQHEAATTDQAKDFDQVMKEIGALSLLIEDLEQRVGVESGLDQEVAELRLMQARFAVLERGLEFVRSVVGVDAQQEGIEPWRERAVKILAAQDSMARTIAADIRSRIEVPESKDSAATQAAGYSRAFQLLDKLNYTYEIFIEGLELSRQLGVDVAQREEQLKQHLAERADNGSALLQITMANLDAMRASAKAVPDDTEIKAKVQVATDTVSRLAEALRVVIAMMEGLEMDTTGYQELLLLATGQVTADVFEVGVFTDLLIGWGQTLWDVVIESGPGLFFNVLLFALIAFVFYKLANLAQMLVERALDGAEIELSLLLRRMVRLVVRNTILFLGVLIALAQVGISLGPLLAGLGVVGFIVGFALQDTLSNFAAGMLILIYRPFDVDDFVEVGGVSGKVSHMSLVNTTILTLDNQTIVVPNGKIWGDVIKNVTAQKARRIDMVFGISYSDDIPKTEKILQEILESHDSVLDDPEPIVRVHELGDSSVNFAVRPWVKTDDYFETYWAITRAVKMRFDEEGISIPFPQTDVHLYKE
ncbi:MAG: mechanosensitive ion channel [Gammaproteobacteria bacterium]|jgi:small conductance mechanosensitive channel|nr:mechanosensitive ion channel [Gammaproteobacteria bacterium]